MMQEEGAVTLCRHLPPRFDFCVTAWLPIGDPVRLAHQIRQDMWRALQSLRGFSPVVKLLASDGGWQVMAGGRAAAAVPPLVIDRLEALLSCASARRRWVEFARRGRYHG